MDTLWLDEARSQRLAPAKINLTLHVTGQRDDGYHLLDSLVVFAELGDHLRLEPKQDDLSLEITGEMSGALKAEPDNLVLRAARLMGAQSGGFVLDKRLPVASGMGGGSSDAAAALALLRARDGSAVPTTDQLMTLGADLPVCAAAPTPSRMQGLGEMVSPVASLPALWLLIVNPGQGLSTPSVFKALPNKSNPAMPATLPALETSAALCQWLATQRNDLQAPACGLLPVINDVLSALKSQRECGLARMTGSGATCFGIFPDERRCNHAAEALQALHPNWFVASTRSFASPEA